MKRLIVFVTAMAAVVLFNIPSFAAGNSDMGMSSEKAANNTFSERELRGLKVVNHEGAIIGEIQDFNKDSMGRIDSVTLKDLNQEHYGLAPAWQGRERNANPMMEKNPTLQGVFDNTGN